MTRERLALANEPRSRKGKEGYRKQPNILIIKNMEDIQKYILIAGGLMFFVGIMAGGSGSGSSKRTDGVYESAVSKLDSGQQLNERETQRMSDIINWCNKCNGPLRSCNH